MIQAQRSHDLRRRVAAVNPLAVDSEGLDELTWRARVLKKASHCAHILLHAWGERDFNSKPLLFKFCSWYLETLGLARLLLPEVRCFFDPNHPIYSPLSQLAPDPIARQELLQLAELRFVDREELIASTKNRFLGFLKNPIVELSLGKLGAVLDARTLIQEGAIVLINVEPGGVLRDEDREILANDAHADRGQIQPSVEEAMQLRVKGENFAWRLSEELLRREVPIEAGTDKTIPHAATKLSGHAEQDLLAMLQGELQIKNQQIVQQGELISKQMELISGLSERLREGNILIGSPPERRSNPWTCAVSWTNSRSSS